MKSSDINNMRINSHFAIQIVLALLLNACAQTYPPDHPHTDKVFSATKATPAATPAENSAKTTATAESNSVSTPSSYKAPRKFFNVSVHEINAREFFMGLVMDSKENIVVHPEVKGTISLVLKNVTLPEIMDVVEKVYGYDCKKTAMGYIVYPATLQSKVFKIDRLDLLREGRSNTLVTSGQHSSQSSQQGNYNQPGYNQQNYAQPSNANQVANNPQGINMTSPQNAQANGSWIRTSSNTDFWDELDKALHSIIAVDPQATVVINRQSGVVVVRAKPLQLHEVDKFLATTENQMGRQVILEAKIMEVILDDSHQDGVNWKILAKKGLDAIELTTGFGMANPSKFASIFTLGSNAGDFSAMVELLETQGKTNVLSSPRISTLNNQKAIIKVGRDEYFATGFSAVGSANALTTSTSIFPTLSSFFSGIALDVTPQIDDHQNITLHIHPSITKVETLYKSFVIDQTDSPLPTALSTVRESDSIVKAQNGQVIVLGGLMQENEIENKEGLTGLARIPFIGHLFRVDKGSTEKSELIILLKASIINNSSDWQDNLDLSKPRFEQLEAQPMWK